MTDKIPKADRRGNTIFVPLGLAIVFVVLACLMLIRGSPDGKAPADMTRQSDVRIPR